MGYAYLFYGMYTILNEFFRKPEIYNVDNVCIFASSHQEIIGFDISMQNIFFVQKLNSIQHLLAYLQNCFKWQFFGVFIEKILKAWSQ